MRADVSEGSGVSGFQAGGKSGSPQVRVVAVFNGGSEGSGVFWSESLDPCRAWLRVGFRRFWRDPGFLGEDL